MHPEKESVKADILALKLWTRILILMLFRAILAEILMFQSELVVD